jgi:hypothetical protein
MTEKLRGNGGSLAVVDAAADFSATLNVKQRTRVDASALLTIH